VTRLRASQDVQTEVAASFGSFVVLLGEHGADQADQAAAVGKIPTTSVRRRISRLRLLGVVAPDLPPDLAWEDGERQAAPLLLHREPIDEEAQVRGRSGTR